MNKIKDALRSFLGYDAVLEWDCDGSTISGMNDIIFVTIRSPKSTPNNKWDVSVHPRILVDTGYDITAGVGTYEDTDVEVCNWFADYNQYIYDRLLEILSEHFTEVLK